VIVHGVIYDVDNLINRHPGGVKGIIDYLGKDASRVFPRLPPVYLPEKVNKSLFPPAPLSLRPISMDSFLSVI
jgi:hypothetical protein